ncbi:uncharacterized protein LOC112051215 isoform X2 [Bicyclus anynana]|nr:uncharacterized protein LOC112051215 isoform X2 [Bicyclus anynana]
MFPSCMSLLPRRNEPRPPRPGQAPVVLNVYDMYWTNWYTAGAGVGVFHSGVQVHSSEWAYGGHPYAFTGVFEITPRDERELGEQFRFRYTSSTANCRQVHSGRGRGRVPQRRAGSQLVVGVRRTPVRVHGRVRDHAARRARAGRTVPVQVYIANSQLSAGPQRARAWACSTAACRFTARCGRTADTRTRSRACSRSRRATSASWANSSGSGIHRQQPTVGRYTAGAGVGVFHSGVQVHSSLWAYGGHPYAFTGVFEITPRDERELGEQFRFRQSVHIGYTDFSEEEVRRLVTELGKQFRGDRYHLMNNNCNHFTSAFCLALCDRDIPAWVNRLAYVSSCVPFLQRCLPKEWLTPAALQHSLAAHSRSSSPATPSTPQ